LERCTVAASADTHKAINRPNAKTGRIASSPAGIAQASSVADVGTDVHPPNSRSVKSTRMKFNLMDAGELRTHLRSVVGDRQSR
jgi:hypothetical protein